MNLPMPSFGTNLNKMFILLLTLLVGFFTRKGDGGELRGIGVGGKSEKYENRRNTERTQKAKEISGRVKQIKHEAHRCKWDGKEG